MSIHEATQTAVPTYPLARGRSLFRDLDRPADAVAQLGPNWFASVMGTGIVATAALLVPHLPAGQLRLTMPTLWIVLGPLGQSITAANLLGEVAHLELPAPYSSAFAALS
jgi:tellurite resistance protein TehA-like permease